MRFFTVVWMVCLQFLLCNEKLFAQSGFPPVRWSDVAPPASIPLWPSQGVVSVSEEANRGFASVLAKRADFPKDSIRLAVEHKGQDWLKYLEKAPRKGLHQDAYVEVAAMARKDALAQEEINKRLSTSDISLKDKAYAYETAVRVFATPGDPNATTRLPIAERYLQGLISMGTSPVPVTRQFNARISLLAAYYEANRPADVVRHGLAVVELLPHVPFGARSGIYRLTPLEMFVDALIRIPDGKFRIGSIAASLRKFTAPPADSVAIDSAFYWRSTHYIEALDEAIRLTDMLGQKRGHMYSNFWINTPDTSAHAVEVNDGKIRIIEIGSHWCGICLQGLDALQRVQNTFPQIETVFLTFTTGTWGNRIVTPEEESYLLADLYKNKRKITLPIALWRQQLASNEDGDRVPVGDIRDNYKRYPQIGKPQYYILDGNGTVRKVFTTWSREIEERMVEAVGHLLREQTLEQAKQKAQNEASTQSPS